MGLYTLIAAEYGFHMPDSVPVYHLMHVAAAAEKRRSDRMAAATEGKTYIG